MELVARSGILPLEPRNRRKNKIQRPNGGQCSTRTMWIDHGSSSSQACSVVMRWIPKGKQEMRQETYWTWIQTFVDQYHDVPPMQSRTTRAAEQSNRVERPCAFQQWSRPEKQPDVTGIRRERLTNKMQDMMLLQMEQMMQLLNPFQSSKGQINIGTGHLCGRRQKGRRVECASESGATKCSAEGGRGSNRVERRSN